MPSIIVKLNLNFNYMRTSKTKKGTNFIREISFKQLSKMSQRFVSQTANYTIWAIK